MSTTSKTKEETSMTSAPKSSQIELGSKTKIRKVKAADRPGFLVYLILSVVVLVSAWPLWWSFVIGSRQSSDVNLAPPAFVPGPNFLENAMRVFDNMPFWTALGNSILVSTIVTISVVFFSTLAGFAFAKLRFKGKGALLTGVVATMAIPPQLGVIPLLMIMNEIGWRDTLWALIIPALVSAFGVFFMTQYLSETIPDELIEAARIDGATTFRTFFTVGIPAARPAMSILALFTFMGVYTDFFWPSVVLRRNSPTIQTALAELRAVGGHSPDEALILTGSILATIPLLILFIIAGKQLVSGIMAGAVKG